MMQRSIALLAPALLASLLALNTSAAAAGAGDSPEAPIEMAIAAASGPHLVKLWRVPGTSQGSSGFSFTSNVIAPAGREEQGFYVGRLTVGQPSDQELLVGFDTASGQVILPSARCRSPACLRRRAYSIDESATAVDINADGTLVEEGHRLARVDASRDSMSIGLSSMDLGDGKVIGHLVYDTLCLDGSTGDGAATGKRRLCSDAGIVNAMEMTEVPFAAMPQDGMIGLGLDGLSINPLFSLFGSLANKRPDNAGGPGGGVIEGTPLSALERNGLLPQFALFLGTNGGELAIGGHNPVRLRDASLPLAWAPVVQPEEGYWQVNIDSFGIGEVALDACAGGGGRCRGIIDSCASGIGVPAALMEGLLAAVTTEQRRASPASATQTPEEAASDIERDGCRGPELRFDVGGNVSLTLLPEDYLGPGPGCLPRFTAMHGLPEKFDGVFVIGEPLLRRYYSVFDWESKSVGFGLAAGPVASEEAEELSMAPPMPRFEGSQLEIGAEAQSLLGLLIVAMATQVAVVVALTVAGPYVSQAKLQLLRWRLGADRMGFPLAAKGPVQKLPTGELPHGHECVICLGSCEDDCKDFANEEQQPKVSPWCRLHCGHSFHEPCIFEWLAKTPRCPVCRRHVLEAAPAAKGWNLGGASAGAAGASPAVFSGSVGLAPVSGSGGPAGAMLAGGNVELSLTSAF